MPIFARGMDGRGPTEEAEERREFWRLVARSIGLLIETAVLVFLIFCTAVVLWEALTV